MESHNNLRLLFISLYLVVAINAARPTISPTPHPSPKTQDPIMSYAQFLPPSKDTKADTVQPLDLISSFKSFQEDPEVKKICDGTDHPLLCIATVVPFVKSKGQINVDSVLEAAVKATDEFAKQAQAVAKEIANKPGTSPELASTLKDCKDGYETAVDNFQKTLEAFPQHDVGTMRSMLSAVITFVSDCEDSFAQMKTESPLSDYAHKLQNMTSNCLAIVSQLNIDNY